MARDVTDGGQAGRRLTVEAKTAPQQNPPDLWLLFAPIKKARTDFIVEKAAELGAARIMPVQTEFTNAERIRRDRLQAHAVEAAEQCGGTYVPPVEDLQASVGRAVGLARRPAPDLRGRGAGGRAEGALTAPMRGNGRS
jgi:16S rRNA U1498 N3-methylase RsmE